ncbi:hypothetical protein N5D52_09975 [Pseudomonas sp. GD03860]|uniref:hypothetical protein n=1 Tax=Pseudomonas TaxID=286 RepID=UPI002363F23F|nr:MULTISPECIES: hypothetical protein [Pseudomonas]MDD2056363.1 hypothetical protein [Pseudomonas putida]MDH0637269.1 hypothetical protein [Pseudomonas sp. GD03860]
MIIINSAAYVIPEFRTEFGRIPPCLLPLGNKKLLEYQVPMLRKACGEQIYVSLPNGYELTIDETHIFKALDIEPVYVPEQFSLAEALLFVLNTVTTHKSFEEPLRLLHGDTLLDEIPRALDIIAVAPSDDDYNWESEKNTAGSPLVWCGYFSFSSPRHFIRSLALSQGNFVKSVRLYSDFNTLSVEEASGWHDLGHVNTYFSSRSQITTQRVFNDLRIENGIVWKSGTAHKKILAESEWFKKLPIGLRRYTPQLIDSGLNPENGAPYYVLEYLPCSPLNEVFVHGRNPDFFWRRIFKLTAIFLNDARACASDILSSAQIDSIAADAIHLYENKTYARLEEYCSATGLNLSASMSYGRRSFGSLLDIAKDCIQRTLALPLIPTILHGDLCFSNILFDSRSVSLKVIDPRGMNQKQELTLLGDQKYDLAKACHSVVGLYDFIIAGRYQIERFESQAPTIRFRTDDRLLNIQKSFLDAELIPGIEGKAILPLTVLLFLSMLPLHSDRPDRQEAMLINALRLYDEYVA